MLTESGKDNDLQEELYLYKKIRNYIYIGGGAIIIWSFLLITAYALPMQPIKEHIKESIKTFEMEGLYPQESVGDISSQLDNFTDAYMLNISGYDGNESVLQKAFGSYYTTYKDSSNPIDYLYYDSDTKDSYARYWHGYVVFLKGLLIFFNYEQIRKLLYVIDLFAIIWSVLELQKKEKKYILPFLISLLFFPLTVISKSIQFSTVFIPTIISCGLCVKYHKKLEKNEGYFFFIEGSIIAFLDLLTYPLVNLGFLLCFILIFEKDKTAFQQLKETLSRSFVWALGYGITWASKWVLATIFLRENIIMNALNQASFRTSNNTADSTWSYLDVLKNNINVCSKLLPGLAVLFLLIVFLKIMITKKSLQWNNKLISYLTITIMPFVWYFVLSNHSYIHYFFTHRILAVSFLAILFGFLQISDTENKL